MHSETSALQIFLWEKFRVVAPNPEEYPTIEMIETITKG